MSQGAFSGKQIQQAIRKFNNHAQDTLNSLFQNYGDNLGRLVQFLETDPVMAVVTEPLKQNPHIDIKQWYQDFLETGGSFVGSKHYELPQDEDDRLALVYQFLLKVLSEDESESIDLTRFCIDAYGETKYQRMIDVFNAQLLAPFLRDFSTRLDEDIDVARDQEIPSEQLRIFQNYGIVVSGNVQGSNFATGQAQITSSTASVSNSGELAGELRRLHEFLNEVPNDDKASTRSAINTLVKAAENQPTSKSALVESVETISAKSLTMRRHLQNLVVAASANLASHAVIQAVSFVLSG